MHLLDRLERKFGKFAIKGLMTGIIGINLAVYLITMFTDTEGRLVNLLIMNPAKVMEGEIWRLITFIFIPPFAQLIWIIFTLYFYYLIGSGLEHEWGSFKFNVYYLVGMIGTVGAAFISGGEVTAVYLNLSLFLAFASVYPNYQILLFFILPIKIKYLAILNAAFLIWTFFSSGLTGKLAIAAAFANFLLFFGKEMVFRVTRKGTSYYSKKQFTSKIPKIETFHCCTVCGRTEKDDINLEFRYCSGCEGDYEYCMEHLKDHEHKKAE